MTKFCFFGACLLFSFFAIAQDSIQARIVLIGDAGDITPAGQVVISGVKKNIPLDKKTTIIFLGDNLYTYGLPDDQASTYSRATAILDSQANIASGTQAQVFFIPGNHDWAHEGPDGWAAVQREQAYIEYLADDTRRVHFFPQDGCPGPVVRELTKEVVLVMMDTQWWLHKYDKPGIESDCPAKTKEEVLNQLGDILDNNSEKLVILAMHHPFKSYGSHGGYYTWKEHIFPFTEFRKNLWIPLPIIGSIYPITRGVFGTPQDLKHPAYQNMINQIQQVVNGHPHTIFVAGHEHNQQLIYDSSYYYIVEGAGYKHTRVSKGKNSIYATDTTGFATLDISTNKNVQVNFYNVQGTETHLNYSQHLFNFSKSPALIPADTIKEVFIPLNADSITIAINKKYTKASAFKRYLNGNNYRATWATPVRLKIFDLRQSGMAIESLGGGKQTISLTLRDKDGKRWALRTIDKNLEKVLPDNFRNTAAVKYLSDFVSTAHPYAPLIVPAIANAANVIVAKPKFYFVPEDRAFGKYKNLFANKVVMIEEKEPIPKGDDTKSTNKVINELLDDNDNRVDQKAVLNARLLDILLADWDRHFDQWKFWERDTGKGKLYVPVPRDRDQALSYSDGLFLKLLAYNQLPYLQGFKKTIPSIKWLSWEARDFDRIFLNKLDEDQFRKIVAEFQQNLSDKVIEQAVRNMPADIFALNGEEIINKLKSRRNILMKEAMKYYKYLSREVNVVGSNKKEYFSITSVGKNLEVKVFKRNKESDSVALMYKRQFDPLITKEVRLFGLKNNDYFFIDSNASSAIKLRIIGGRDEDTFNIKGHVKNIIYDVNNAKNVVLNKSRTKLQISDDISANDYSPTGFEYNRTYFPLVNMGYNVEDGLMFGLGISYITHGFRKAPYASSQKFTSLYALNRGSFQLKYRGDFTEVFDKTGLLLNAEVLSPVLNNFYGLGNNTISDPAKGIEFYRVRYKYAKAQALLTRRPFSSLILGAGAELYHYWIDKEDNENKILDRPSLIGLDSVNVYQTKTFVGARFLATINTLNNELFPTRGILFTNELLAMGGINKNSKPLTMFTSDMTIYTSWREPAKVVTVLKLGGGRILSKNYEYFQALSLGQNNFLRGFRKNRFAGESIAYGSFEVRHKLFNSKSYLFPGTVGVITFAETGRVWTSIPTPVKWHFSYGGGLYYAAYNKVLISSTIALSNESSLFNFTLGTKFNLTF